VTAISTLEQHKAQAIEEAFEALEGFAPSERLIQTKNEPIRQPEYALPVLVAELTQALAAERARGDMLQRALDHVIPGEVATLRRRLEKLEAPAQRSRSGAKKS
jgi:hypothetical protein